MSDRMHKLSLLLALVVVIAGPGCAASAQTGRVDANGITIAYESIGAADREAVLLVMGLGAQMTGWPDELCEELVRRGYRVIRFDNRDVGLSTHLDTLGQPDWQGIFEAQAAGAPPPLPYSLEDMAHDAAALLGALGIDRAHVVGASMGGGIAQLFAIHYPERTLSLTSIFSDTGNPEMPGPTPEVLAMPPAPPPDSDIEDIVERELAVWRIIGSPDHPTDERLLRERIRRDVERSYNPVAEERQAAAVMFAGDRRAELRQLDVPTVVLHGDADPLVPIENGRDTAASIPGAELRIIPGMGHDLPLALVEEFADAITAAASRAAGGKAK